MKRFDFFQPIHNQIRTQLYETGAWLQQADVDETLESGVTVSRLQAVVNLLQAYLAFGERHILPAVIAYESAIADSLVQERANLSRLLKPLEVRINVQEKLSQQTVLDSDTEGLATCFESLALQTIQYLRREENLAGKILWRYYSDAELQAMATSLRDDECFTMLPVAAKTVAAKTEASAATKVEENQFATETFYQTMTARAASFIYPQQRSLLQDVLAGGMVV
ncbi:hypothetical protein HRG84_06340 [Flavisolibacter sp. BT320]|nr:hypothetical protein [Flavisolibacter longurius]